MKYLIVHWVVAVALLGACTSETGEPPVELGPEMEPLVFAATSLGFGMEERPGEVPGIDLDGRITADTSDREGCGHVDHSWDGAEGVDSRFGLVLEALGQDGDFTSDVLSGNVVLLFEISRVNSFTNDDDVSVDMFVGELPAGVATPALEGTTRLAAGQTFDVRESSLQGDGVTPRSRIVDARIEDGVLLGGPTEWALPIDVSGETLALNLQGTRVRMHASEDALGLSVIGASLDVNDLVAQIVAAAPDLGEPLLRGVFEPQADINPDASGQCQSISLGLWFEAVPAVRGTVVP